MIIMDLNFSNFSKNAKHKLILFWRGKDCFFSWNLLVNMYLANKKKHPPTSEDQAGINFAL